VHGGQTHLHPTARGPPLLESLRALIPLAPLHLPGGIWVSKRPGAGFRRFRRSLVSDTSFHASLPEYAARFRAPSQLYDEGYAATAFTAVL